MRRRSFLAATLAAGTAVAGLAGCAEDSDTAADGSFTLDFLSLAWQAESVTATKELVREWNKRNPKTRVRYVQGSWDTVHDQLLTSFESGTAPDIIHDETNDLTDFAHGGYLADLGRLLPADLRERIPEQTWQTAALADGLYGVPFSQEPRVLIANRRLLERAGVRLPTVVRPWSWPEFEQVAKELTGRRGGSRHYGVAWAMKEPVNQSINLAPTTGGRIFYREDGKNVIRYGEADSAVAEVVHRQVNEDGTAARSSLGMSGSDVLPGFFAGRYAMLPLNFSYRQQVQQQAPDDFDWVTLPLPAGDPATGGGSTQGSSPQTLSIAEDCRHKETAMAFLAFLTQTRHLVRLARGDWLLPTGTEALKDPSLNTEEHGWRTGTETARDLVASPVLGVRGYPEWKDKVATPAFQQYYSGAIDLDSLRNKLVDDGNRILARYQR